MMKKNSVLSVACFVAILGAASHAMAAHQVVFSDQNFFTEDWTPIVHVTDDPNVGGTTPLTSTGSITRRTTGGNGGAYLQSILRMTYGDSLTTTGIYVEESYDPRQRAISTVDFSFSVRHFFNFGVTNVAPTLLQNGRLFVGPAQSFTGNQWVQRSYSGLNADDFLAIDFFITGETIRPDFSAFGDPMQFGYALGNVVVLGGPGGDPFVRGMDNWSVTINRAAMSDILGNGVDGTDLDFWNAGYGTAGDALLTDGDFDADADTDGADFLQWQREFDTGVTAHQSVAVTTVPEPTSLTMLAMLAATSGCFRKRFSRHPFGHGNLC